MDSVVGLVAGHVEGAARRAVEAAQAEQHTGISDHQRWAVHAPLWDRLIDAGATRSTVTTPAGAWSPARIWRAGRAARARSG